MVDTRSLEPPSPTAASVLAGLRVGYAPLSPSLEQPGDRRRFPWYAALRGVDFEIADPTEDYDVVIVSQRADIVRWANHRGRARLVYDLIDAYLAGTATDWKSRGRGVAKFAIGELSRPTVDYRGAMEAMCRRVDAIVCSTPEQRRDIEPFSDNVHVVLDAHFELGTSRKTDHRTDETFSLLWEGQGENVPALDVIADGLRGSPIADRVAVHLLTDLTYHRYLRKVGRRSTVKVGRRLFPNVFFYEWNPHLFGAIAAGCDLALVPVNLDDPLTAGKPENKLLMFWRLGIPALVSASAAHERVMREAGVEMTCRTADDWRAGLERFLPDDEARREAADRGLRYVEAHHGREPLLARWDRVFESIVA